jgi:GT2 family glycosyltransferase
MDNRLRVEVALCTVGRPSVFDTLRALCRQTRPLDRLIVVNQGEPNLQSEISGHYSGDVEFIQLSGRGLSRARNAAVRASRGDWLMWIDDDEEPCADWAAQLCLLAESYPHIAFFAGPMLPPLSIPAGEHVDELYSLGDSVLDESTFLTSPADLPGLMLDCWGGNMAFRRDVLDSVGLFDESLGAGTEQFPFGEETDYVMRAISAGFVGMLSARMPIYHTHGARALKGDEDTRKLRSSAAIVWKSEKHPALIKPALADRLKPFGKKKLSLSRLSGGLIFADQHSAHKAMQSVFADLDAGYELRNGCITPKA